jgi:hypothetical protein
MSKVKITILHFPMPNKHFFKVVLATVMKVTTFVEHKILHFMITKLGHIIHVPILEEKNGIAFWLKCQKSKSP